MHQASQKKNPPESIGGSDTSLPDSGVQSEPSSQNGRKVLEEKAATGDTVAKYALDELDRRDKKLKEAAFFKENKGKIQVSKPSEIPFVERQQAKQYARDHGVNIPQYDVREGETELDAAGRYNDYVEAKNQSGNLQNVERLARPEALIGWNQEFNSVKQSGKKEEVVDLQKNLDDTLHASAIDYINSTNTDPERRAGEILKYTNIASRRDKGEDLTDAEKKYLLETQQASVNQLANEQFTKAYELEQSGDVDEYIKGVQAINAKAKGLKDSGKLTEQAVKALEQEQAALVEKTNVSDGTLDEINESFNNIKELSKVSNTVNQINNAAYSAKDEKRMIAEDQAQYAKDHPVLSLPQQFTKGVVASMGKAAMSLGQLPEVLKAASGDITYDATNIISDSIQEAKDNPTFNPLPKDAPSYLKASYDLGTAVGSISTFAVGGSSRAATAGIAFLTSEADAFKEAYDMGMNKQEAGLYSSFISSLTSLSEGIIPDSKYFTETARASVINAFRQGKPMKEAIGDALKMLPKSAEKYIETSGKEGLEEGISYMTQVVGEQAANDMRGDEELPTGFTVKRNAQYQGFNAEDLKKNILLGAAAGGFMQVFNRPTPHSKVETEAMLDMVETREYIVSELEKTDPEKAAEVEETFTAAKENLDALKQHPNWNDLDATKQAHVFAIAQQINSIEKNGLKDPVTTAQVERLNNEMNELLSLGSNGIDSKSVGTATSPQKVFVGGEQADFFINEDGDYEIEYNNGKSTIIAKGEGAAAKIQEMGISEDKGEVGDKKLENQNILVTPTLEKGATITYNGKNATINKFSEKNGKVVYVNATTEDGRTLQIREGQTGASKELLDNLTKINAGEKIEPTKEVATPSGTEVATETTTEQAEAEPVQKSAASDVAPLVATTSKTPEGAEKQQKEDDKKAGGEPALDSIKNTESTLDGDVLEGEVVSEAKILSQKHKGSLFKGETWKDLANKVDEYFLPKFNKPLTLTNSSDKLSDNVTKSYGENDIEEFISDYEKYPDAIIEIKAGKNSVALPKEVSSYLKDRLAGNAAPSVATASALPEGADKSKGAETKATTEVAADAKLKTDEQLTKLVTESDGAKIAKVSPAEKLRAKKKAEEVVEDKVDEVLQERETKGRTVAERNALLKAQKKDIIQQMEEVEDYFLGKGDKEAVKKLFREGTSQPDLDTAILKKMKKDGLDVDVKTGAVRLPVIDDGVFTINISNISPMIKEVQKEFPDKITDDRKVEGLKRSGPPNLKIYSSNLEDARTNLETSERRLETNKKFPDLSKTQVNNLEKLRDQFKEDIRHFEELEKETVADKIRSLKVKGKTFESTLGIPVAVYNGALEAAALAWEGSKIAADAISAAIDHIKKSKWYKDLSEEDKAIAEAEIRDDISDAFEEETEPEVAIESGFREAADNEKLVVSEDKEEGEKLSAPETGEETPKSVLNRVFEGTAPKRVKEVVEKLGLTYKVEKQADAEGAAREFIKKVGLTAAVQAVKENRIDGGMGAFVWVQAIDEVGNLLAVATDPTEIAQLEALERDLIKELDKRARDKGRFNSALGEAYAQSNLGYKLSSQIAKYEQITGEEIPQAVKERFKEYDAKLADAKKKLAEAEERARIAEEQTSVSNIAEDVTRQKKAPTAKEISTKLAAKIRTAKLTRPTTFSAASPAAIVWDGAVELVATTVEAGGAMADAIKKGVDYIKNSDWYKSLDEETQKTAQKEFKKSMSESRPQIEVTEDKIKIPTSIIREFVSGGLTNMDDLSQAVLDEIKDENPELTLRDVRDAITGYGKKVSRTRPQIDSEINQLKTIGRLQSKLEDLRNNIVREKNTSKKKVLSDKEIQLREEIDLVLSEMFPSMSPEERRTEAAKQRVKSKIDELQNRIKNQDFSKKVVKPVIEDTELVKLRAEKQKWQDAYDRDMYQAQLDSRSRRVRWEDRLVEIWGLTRALMATAEFSFLLIQGGIQSIAHPIHAAKAFKVALQNGWSEKKAQAYSEFIRSQPWYDQVKRSKLALSEYDARLELREEQFLGGWVNAIWDALGYPLRVTSGKAYDFWKKINPVKAVERAGVGFLNTLRIQRFLDGMYVLNQDGKTFEKNPQDFVNMADAINTMTGRASLGPLEGSHKVKKALALLFFSPRNWVAQLKTTTPLMFYHFGKMGYKDGTWRPSAAQKMFMADYMKFVGVTAATVAAIAAAYNDDDEEDISVETDPRSSDFGKIRIGNTRIDPWGGRIQQITYQARMIMDALSQPAYKSTSSGDVNFLGGKNGMIPNAAELSMQMIQRKLSPSLALIVNRAMTHVDEKTGKRVGPYKDEYSFTSELAGSLYPMYIGTVQELWKDQPETVASFLTAYAFFGGGVQTYESKNDPFGQPVKSANHKAQSPYYQLTEGKWEPTTYSGWDAKEWSKDITDAQKKAISTDINKTTAELMLLSKDELMGMSNEAPEGEDSERIKAIKKLRSGAIDIAKVKYLTGEYKDVKE